MDEATCPICGGENHCGATRGSSPRACWCSQVQVPQDLLERLPTSERGVRCICRRCIAYYHATGRLRRHVPA